MKHTLPALLAGLLFTATMIGQQPTPAAAPVAYKIRIVLHDKKPGQPDKIRTFAFDQNTKSSNRLQDGDRVPIETGGGQVTYNPVGVSIVSTLPDAREIHPGLLPLALTVEISSVVASPGGAVPRQPVFRSATTKINTVVPLGKTTPVASFSDMAGDETFQVDVLAEALP